MALVWASLIFQINYLRSKKGGVGRRNEKKKYSYHSKSVACRDCAFQEHQIQQRLCPNSGNCNQTNSMNEGKSEAMWCGPLLEKRFQRGPNCAFHLNAERSAQVSTPRQTPSLPYLCQATRTSSRPSRLSLDILRSNVQPKLLVPVPPHSTQYLTWASRIPRKLSFGVTGSQPTAATDARPQVAVRRVRASSKSMRQSQTPYYFQGNNSFKGYTCCGQKSLKAIPVCPRSNPHQNKPGSPSRRNTPGIGTQEYGEFMKFQKEILGYK